MQVHDTGSGTPVVLIPGLGCDHTMYAPQLAELRDEFRCLAVDLRGTGRAPSLDGVPRSAVLTVQAADIVRALDERGITDAHLVGTSYGGAVVEELMIRHRSRVRSAVICDSLCDTRPRTMSERLLMWGARTQPLMYRLPRPWLAAMVRRTYSRWPAAGRAMADAVSTSRRADLIKQRRAINAIHYEEPLRQVDCPTLCLVGDHLPQAVDMMRRVHESLAGSVFQVLPDAFDPSGLCRPSEFTAELRTWVRRSEAGGTDG